MTWAFVQVAVANVSKTEEQVSAGSFQRAIMKYVEAEAKEPISWRDLQTSGISKEVVGLIDKRTPGFRDKYRFLAADKKIMFRRGSRAEDEYEIIAMGNGPRTNAPTSASEVETRILILRDGLGQYSVGTYSEVALAQLFREAGVDLVDFTGTNGMWQPEPMSANGVIEQGNDGKPGERLNSEPREATDRFQVSRLEEGPQVEDAPEEQPIRWQLWLLSLAVIVLPVAVVAYVLIKRNLRPVSQRTP